MKRRGEDFPGYCTEDGSSTWEYLGRGISAAREWMCQRAAGTWPQGDDESSCGGKF